MQYHDYTWRFFNSHKPYWDHFIKIFRFFHRLFVSLYFNTQIKKKGSEGKKSLNRKRRRDLSRVIAKVSWLSSHFFQFSRIKLRSSRFSFTLKMKAESFSSLSFDGRVVKLLWHFFLVNFFFSTVLLFTVELKLKVFVSTTWI